MSNKKTNVKRSSYDRNNTENHARSRDQSLCGIEEIKLQMLPVPEIEADEVLIRIESAGVGVWDAFEREGGFAKMFGVEPKVPSVLGSDGAGTVSAVGEQANRFASAAKLREFAWCQGPFRSRQPSGRRRPAGRYRRCNCFVPRRGTKLPLRSLQDVPVCPMGSSR